MGSPCSPILAELVMHDSINDLLFTSPIPIAYFKIYVDDIIACVPKNNTKDILQLLNSFDDHINLTIEEPKNNSINFLDTTLHWDSSGVVFSLVDRAIKLSDDSFHKQNLKKVSIILQANNYPIEFIAKYTKVRLKKIKFQSTGETKCDNVNFLPKDFVVLPYIKDCDKIFRKGKDSVDTIDKVCSVNGFKCKNCDKHYVGQTSRTVDTRTKEHERDCINEKDSSVVYTHMRDYGHTFNFDSVQVLDQEICYYRRLISEIVDITKLNT
ncbi:uncharacterized protein LOC106645525, partial [Copidosoma floridanum]|uniref:uncharacterized protein LOC106645525 n=1 Tax=Copidosoma floridanum TaxID=29053 RepID=UPI0006C98740